MTKLWIGFRFNEAESAVFVGLGEPLFTGKNPLEGVHFSSTEQVPWATSGVNRELAQPLFELLDADSGINTINVHARYTLFVTYSSALLAQELKNVVLEALRAAGYNAQERAELPNASTEDGQAPGASKILGLSADELAALLKRKEVAEFLGHVAVAASKLVCPLQGMTRDELVRLFQDSTGVQDAFSGLAQDLGGFSQSQHPIMALDNPSDDDLDGPATATDAGGWTTH